MQQVRLQQTSLPRPRHIELSPLVLPAAHLQHPRPAGLPRRRAEELQRLRGGKDDTYLQRGAVRILQAPLPAAAAVPARRPRDRAARNVRRPLSKLPLLGAPRRVRHQPEVHARDGVQPVVRIVRAKRAAASARLAAFDVRRPRRSSRVQPAGRAGRVRLAARVHAGGVPEIVRDLQRDV